jgi:hypothetical protein
VTVLTRREILLKSASGMGSWALASLLGVGAARAAAKAKRVVFIFQSGGPSQLDLFDYKPKLAAMDGMELPASVRQGQRLTTMTANQSSLPITASPFSFAQCGSAGMWMSELLPFTAGIADDLCFVRTLYTDAINHDPGITMMQTGSTLPGRPSFGAWISYGLGALTDNLPTFVVMTSRNTSRSGQPLVSRYWGPGFLPANHQGVQLRTEGDPVLFLGDGTSGSDSTKGRMRSTIHALDERRAKVTLDPALSARIDAYELAYRMQIAVPGVVDISKEPASILSMYGPDVHTPGTPAANCLLARRLLEQGVRFVQLYHRDWDHHATLQADLRRVARESDQASAALVTDLAQRGLLDDTLVIWAGEFGRTVYAQGTRGGTDWGRDHHPRCTTFWMAGGGTKRGYVHGTTDDFSYNIVDGGVHVHDFHATALALLGIDHRALTYRSQGRDFRLTDVAGEVVSELIA